MIVLGLVVLASAVICAALILLLRPLLLRYALARPNARSSHRVPTPQGAGMAVVAATLLAGGAGLAGWPVTTTVLAGTASLAGAASLLAVVGAFDDIRPLSPLPRLAVQMLCVTLVLIAAGEARLAPDFVPLWLERVGVILAGMWFINLVNFMDGIDWMTVAETVPICAAVALFGLAGFGSPDMTIVAGALLGAMLGFAPFNKPVARLFLGDVGSLPIGLVTAWLLYRLAEAGHLAAAVLLPLYYIVDATLTLLKRLARGERVWEAHRSHYYQQATANGFTVPSVIAHVFGLNLALAALAATTLLWPTAGVQLAALALGSALVGVVLLRFANPRGAGVSA